MTAKVLVVDDVPRNLKLLEAKLTAEYFDVSCAANGLDALAIIERDRPDIVLLDVMMPGMDGLEVCRRIKADPNTTHIPVIMVTALDQSDDRVSGLEAGADDFLTKPVNDLALFSRVRSLVRLKLLADELRMRRSTSESMGVADSGNGLSAQPDLDARIVLLEDHPHIASRMASAMESLGAVRVTDSTEKFLREAREGDTDLLIISLNLRNSDGLRICSGLRSNENLRQVPILVLVEDGEIEKLAKALEIGVTDYVVRPVDRHELLARARTQIRRKRYADQLKKSLDKNMRLAVTDAVTGLYNRHYMESHLDMLMQRARHGGKSVSLMIVDIDFFKQVNDTHGHAIGDAVLRSVAERIAKNTRGIDLVARYGGEEFVVVMPDTDLSYATAAAERLCRHIREERFEVFANEQPGQQLSVTISIGVAMSNEGAATSAEILKAADDALYRAKREGRDRVRTAT